MIVLYRKLHKWLIKITSVQTMHPHNTFLLLLILSTAGMHIFGIVKKAKTDW